MHHCGYFHGVSTEAPDVHLLWRRAKHAWLLRVLELFQQALQLVYTILLCLVKHKLLFIPHVVSLYMTMDSIVLTLTDLLQCWLTMSSICWLNSVVLMASDHIECLFLLGTDDLFQKAHNQLLTQVNYDNLFPANYSSYKDYQ